MKDDKEYPKYDYEYICDDSSFAKRDLVLIEKGEG
jgi:hypothetical protein